MRYFISTCIILSFWAFVVVSGLRKIPLPFECKKCTTIQRCVKVPKCQLPGATCPAYKCIDLPEKIGKCPNVVIPKKDCLHDVQCKGTLKCCRGACVPAILPNPCGACKLGYTCVKQNVVCVKEPCDPVWECINTTPKKGECPKILPLVAPPGQCRYDSQCPGNQKCCGAACLNPVERPGRCPFEPMNERVCKRSIKECKTDHDCEAPMKCCGSCKRCKLPMPKSGQCPANVKPGSFCKNDYECKNDDKCCNGNCVDPVRANPCGVCKLGYACVKQQVMCIRAPCNPIWQCVSTAPKKGECPKIMPRVLPPGECRYDSQCFGHQKCCGDACLNPQGRPGRCPFEPLSKRLCKPTIKRECNIDDDCKSPMKCCGSCKQCKLPMPKSGQCPADVKPDTFCKNDYECKNDDKCCNGNCVDPVKKNPCGGCKTGFACVSQPTICKKLPCLPAYTCVSTKPKPGKCPRILPIGPAYVQCTYDRECKSTWKCCSRRCVPPENQTGDA